MLFDVEFSGGEKGTQVEKLNVRRNRIEHQQHKVGSGEETCRPRDLRSEEKEKWQPINKRRRVSMSRRM